MQRRVADRHALADEQFADLGEPQSVVQRPLDRRPVELTPTPAVATRTSAGRMQREKYVARLLVADRTGVDPHARRVGGGQIPTDGLGSNPSCAASRFFGRPSPRSRSTSLSSIIVTSRYIHASWPGSKPRAGDLYRAIRRGGKVLKISLRKGGKVLKNLSPEGGKVLKNSSGKGPYVLRTDSVDPKKILRQVTPVPSTTPSGLSRP